MATLLQAPLMRAESGVCCGSTASLLTRSAWTPSSYLGTVLHIQRPSSPRALPGRSRCMARAVAASSAPLVVTHTVGRGESLYSIASRHGVTVEELLLENPHVEAARLQPGTVLVIDDGVHQRLSQQEVKAAARGAGGRRTTGAWVTGIQVLPSAPMAVGVSDWACLASAALLAATLGISAAKQWQGQGQRQGGDARPSHPGQHHSSSSNSNNSSSSSEQGQTQWHSDDELAGLLRDATECIAQLQSELAEQQGQRKALQSKVALLEREMEARQLTR